MIRYERYGKLLATAFLGFLVVVLSWHLAGEWRALNRDLTTRPAGIEADYAYLKPSQEISPDRIAGQAFTLAEWNQIPLAFADQAYWIRLNISNERSTEQGLALIMDNPMINRLTVYQQLSSGELQQILVTGDTVTSETFLNALPHVRLRLAGGGQQTLYLHARTDGAPILPLALMTAEAFDNYEHSLHLLWGAFIGTVLLMTVYNLLLYIGLRDHAYLYYIGYILSLMAMLGVVHGYGFYLFPAPLQQWLSRQVISLNTVGTLLTLLFAVNFLKYSTHHGALGRTIRAFCWALLLFLVATLFLPENLSAPLYGPFQILTYALAVWLIARRLPDKLIWTRYYIAAWIPLAIGGAVAYLLFSGFIDYSFYSRHAFPFAITLEMALVSMALADRFTAIEQDRLYQATHDETLGMPNEALLSQAITRELQSGSRGHLALIAAEISNLESLRPYIPEADLRDLMHGLARFFGLRIDAAHQLCEIDTQGRSIRHAAVLRGEVLGFLVRMERAEDLSRLLHTLANHDNFNPQPEKLPFRISCHLAGAAPQTLESPANLLQNVRQALQEARGRQPACHIYTPRADVDRSEQFRLAQDLVNGINHNQLQLFHQPQLSVNEPNVCASELLIRWEHPTRGWIPAFDIITIAEETGLIRSLTRWVVEEGFRQAIRLREAGHPNFLLSINVSGNDMSRQHFAAEIIEALEATALSARQFILEVTESAHLSDQESFQNNFTRLTDAGFRFAIDDFGTGYSSLSYAHQHPFSELKIDRSFVTDITRDVRRQTIVSATLSMARKLKLSITAEGVEDGETAEYLKALGCDRLQGYLIARPMPLDAYLGWLATRAIRA